MDMKKLVFKTNDPAPPFNIQCGQDVAKYSDIQFLEQMLVNKDGENKVLDFNLFERYRALFTLREINSKESILAICSSLLVKNMDSCGPLLKHEVAYVLA